MEDHDLIVLIGEVSDECTVCEKFKKPKSRPVVGLSIAKEFNEVVSMDLKEYTQQDLDSPPNICFYKKVKCSSY